MKKTCRNCNKKSDLKITKENHLYTASGLPNIVLTDVEVRRCPECGFESVVIPRIEELFRTIAFAVIHKPSRLSSAEVRFLRKYLGFSGVDFANHMGVDPSTVSNWENDKQPIGMPSDRLLRLMVVHQAPVENYSLTELTKITEALTPSPEMRVHPKAKGWELAA